MEKELLCLNKLSKQYGHKYALKDVDLSIGRGKIVGLLGPNGSGKTTMIKLINGLIKPDGGEVLINGLAPCPETKSCVSYLPDRMYFADWMRVRDLMKMFEDFYKDFSRAKANEMLKSLGISEGDRIKNLSKGTKEKVQLILVMSREAELYLLDEPIGGVDPATRDYILDTIIRNYDPEAAVVISTHLISDVEKILDEVLFINRGKIMLQASVDDIRQQYGKSVDEYFREVFKC